MQMKEGPDLGPQRLDETAAVKRVDLRLVDERKVEYVGQQNIALADCGIAAHARVLSSLCVPRPNRVPVRFRTT